MSLIRSIKRKAGLEGFSLIELTVVLAIMGILLVGLTAVVPSIKQGLTDKKDGKTLDSSQRLIKGFLIAHNRFPCPDSDSDGLENCGASVHSGKIPYKTLKLSTPVKNLAGQDIAYSVYRNPSVTLSSDADLASLKDRFQPALPGASVSNVSNGLDFCWALKTASRQAASSTRAYVGDSSNPNNQAIIVASPGAKDANNSNGYFDGVNQFGNVGFEQPSKPLDSGYDDIVKSIGFNELAGELNCPILLATVNGSVRGAYAMYDAKRVMDFTVAFRKLAADVHAGNVSQAEFNAWLAAIDTAIYVAQTIIAIAEGAESFGVAIAALAIPSVVAGVLTAKGVLDAANGLSDAKEAKTIADAKKVESDALLVSVTAEMNAKITQAKEFDAKGWFQ